LPRDVININPHFDGPDPAAIAEVLKTNLIAQTYIGAKPFTIKMYEAAKPPPNFPVYTTSQAGTAPTSTYPREVALCLSYYSNFNRPRFRGRLYLPASWFAGAASVRPAGAVITAVLGFGQNVLAKSLPASSYWIVWSTVDKKGDRVTDIWCDDEWDTVRSRGLKATTRQTAKV